jgi:hypothetical protein
MIDIYQPPKSAKADSTLPSKTAAYFTTKKKVQAPKIDLLGSSVQYLEPFTKSRGEGLLLHTEFVPNISLHKLTIGFVKLCFVRNHWC